jgi:hypothetical protein
MEEKVDKVPKVLKEKKLPSRRRKPASKGRIIRVSDLVFTTLNENRGNMSWDELIRRMLWLPRREHERDWIKARRPRPCVEGVLEVSTGQFFLRVSEPWEDIERDAYEVAIRAAARAKTRRVHKPLRLREIP